MFDRQVLSTRIEDIHGEPHRITTYAGGRVLVEPLKSVDTALYARLERRRTMMGNSKRKSGG